MKSLWMFIRYIFNFTTTLAFLYGKQFNTSIYYLFRRKHIAKLLDKKVPLDGQGIIYGLRSLGLKFVKHDFGRVLNMKFTHPTVVIANHESTFDVLAIASYFRNQSLRFVLKESLKYGIPYCSCVMRFLRLAAVNRDNPKQSIAEIKRIAQVAKREGSSVALFPEGTRSRTGKVLPFHSAAIRTIAREKPISIVVVALHNSKNLATVYRHAYFKPCIFHIQHIHTFENVSQKEVVAVLEEARQMIIDKIEYWKEMDNKEDNKNKKK